MKSRFLFSLATLVITASFVPSMVLLWIEAAPFQMVRTIDVGSAQIAGDVTDIRFWGKNRIVVSFSDGIQIFDMDGKCLLEVLQYMLPPAGEKGFAQSLNQRIAPNWKGWLALSPSGKELMLAGSSAVRIINTVTGAESAWLGLGGNDVMYPSYSAQAGLIAFVYRSHIGEVFEGLKSIKDPALPWTEPKTSVFFAGRVTLPFRFSPDATQILCAEGNTAKLYKLLGNSRRGEVTGIFSHKTKIVVADFTPDGKCILTIDETGTNRIWDTNSGAMKYEWKSESLRGLAHFSTEEPVLLTVLEGNVQLRDLNSGKIIAESVTIGSRIKDADFLVNSRSIFSLHDDGVVRFWDSQCGVLQCKIESPTPLRFCAASPDGVQFLTCSGTHSLSFWRRRHVPSRYGILSIPAFWLASLLGVFLLRSLILDWRLFQRVHVN